jgi:hypothetical protein
MLVDPATGASVVRSDDDFPAVAARVPERGSLDGAARTKVRRTPR